LNFKNWIYDCFKENLRLDYWVILQAWNDHQNGFFHIFILGHFSCFSKSRKVRKIRRNMLQFFIFEFFSDLGHPKWWFFITYWNNIYLEPGTDTPGPPAIPSAFVPVNNGSNLMPLVVPHARQPNQDNVLVSIQQKFLIFTCKITTCDREKTRS
jgi:hypothetical protein